ncbi:MAG: C39 family peptidase [Candidatus Sericytochromatia bacterium]
MNFNLPTQQQASSLQTPGQLFAHLPASPPTNQVGQQPVQPVIKTDQSHFSTVSRLIGYLPGIMPMSALPLGNPLRVLRALPGQILHGLERGWQALKDTFTFQFEEKGRLGTAREAEANCGPASATMILKQFGIVPPTMQKLRMLVGAPIGTSGDTFGLSARQVADSVKRTASQNGKFISSDIKTLSNNVDTTLNEMRRRLAAGEKLILLTSNLNTLSRGHYIVVKEVRSDGSILVDDPGRSSGENRVYSRSQLSKALSMRSNNYGLESCLLSFKG